MAILLVPENGITKYIMAISGNARIIVASFIYDNPKFLPCSSKTKKTNHQSKNNRENYSIMQLSKIVLSILQYYIAQHFQDEYQNLINSWFKFIKMKRPDRHIKITRIIILIPSLYFLHPFSFFIVKFHLHFFLT